MGKALLEIAQALATDPRNGIIVLLAMLLGVSIWAFWQERKRNNRIQDERVIDAQESVKLMTNALNHATQAAGENKTSNDALRQAFDTLIKAIT